ncbi:hypothetical protein RVR_10606 [Actinacidiphila reveromycinica]|uniref:Uncharacterized protein n=1 Tax=Actinacidiphila reveromycinica TaxID=659352 RepID=A0A7U3UXW2_9ACTN|nr:hypothetical protein RVR_7744 [Streptomyces sp. SN-593]BBB00660.1 hypothetical protein RVR_10606 [Streptomyces sp. SN-593]
MHRAVLRELNPAIGGLIIRDVRNGDWLVALTPNVAAGDRCVIFNALMTQLDQWEQQGHSMTEVRKYLAGMAVV